MAEKKSGPLGDLIEELCRLPGLGARSAERVALHLLDAPNEQVLKLAENIGKLKTSIRQCSVCFNLAQGDLCLICQDDSRDRSVICVVELPKDVMGIEGSGAYKGLYHVLGGHIAPLEGIGPDKLNIDSLIGRARDTKVKEIILAMNPTIEGDGTALHISSLLEPIKVKITRPARGLASGATIEFSSKDTIAEAITGRGPLP
ncbi:MAG: recombination protein RecR [Phycisphaerae bacterium]|nr:recombination protein RecR [Phycisphaerae bacterium]